MRILFWNVSCENPDTERLNKCISSVEPDIALLCEVTSNHLDSIPFNYKIVANDYLQHGSLSYLAVLSQYELCDPRIITHFGCEKSPASPLAAHMGWVEFLDSVSVTIKINGTSTRFVIAHLSAGCGPQRRRRELQAVAAHIPEHTSCIVAGDFNSFAEPWMAPAISWLASYEKGDKKIRERRMLNSWFAEKGFIPTVHGVTYPRLRLSLDQIFLRGHTLKNSLILPDRWGSDHLPILIEI